MKSGNCALGSEGAPEVVCAHFRASQLHVQVLEVCDFPLLLLQIKEVLEKYLEDEDDMLDMNLTARSASAPLSPALCQDVSGVCQDVGIRVRSVDVLVE